MAQNKILPWAQTSTANTLSDADYASAIAPNGAYADGVKSGQASSHQANKTWRQATAPGSGLAQFLVDNLSVDVTDSDTPATFSSRIANAILKLAQISPFNQSFAAAIGGYRKYAIVSDSSGNFWVSTADQNVTVPGESGAKWRSLFDGYLTAAIAANTYVKKSGDTSIGTQYSNQFFSGGFGGGWNGARTNTGDYGWTNGLAFGNPANDGKYRGTWTVTDVLNEGSSNSSGLNLTGYDAGGTVHQWYFAWNGNITTPKGLVAFQSDLTAEATARTNADNNLQNQINGKQPAGSYVTADAYSSDFGTSDSRVINLAYGHRIQAFKTGNVTNGDIVTFPTSFSSTPSAIICQSSRGDWDVWAEDGTWTTTGFTIDGASQNGGAQPLTVIAIGPK